MKNKIILILLSLLTFFPILTACKDNENTPPKQEENENNNENNSQNENNNENNENTEEKDKFKISTTTYGLYIKDNQESFTVTNASIDTEDDFNFPLEIILHVNHDDWSFVTMLRDSKIEIEDEKIIPRLAVTYKEITNFDLIGSNGSNDIEQIKLKFDRKALKEGTTKIKFSTIANNGNATGKESIICFEIVVKNYGDILVDTNNVSIKFKLDDLKNELIDNNKYKDFKSLFIYVGYKNKDEVIFGSNALISKTIDFKTLDEIKDTSFNNLKLDKNVSYVIRVVLGYNLDNKLQRDYLEVNLSNIDSEFKNSENILKINKDIESDCNIIF